MYGRRPNLGFLLSLPTAAEVTCVPVVSDVVNEQSPDLTKCSDGGLCKEFGPKCATKIVLTLHTCRIHSNPEVCAHAQSGPAGLGRDERATRDSVAFPWKYIMFIVFTRQKVLTEGFKRGERMILNVALNIFASRCFATPTALMSPTRPAGVML